MIFIQKMRIRCDHYIIFCDEGEYLSITDKLRTLNLKVLAMIKP